MKQLKKRGKTLKLENFLFFSVDNLKLQKKFSTEYVKLCLFMPKYQQKEFEKCKDGIHTELPGI